MEDSTDPRCYVDGERTSEQTRYALVIDHSICGSWVNQSSVVTYVIVQENPSILTHTARRFVVVCHHQPDVFVVESGSVFASVQQCSMWLSFLFCNNVESRCQSSPGIKHRTTSMTIMIPDSTLYTRMISRTKWTNSSATTTKPMLTRKSTPFPLETATAVLFKSLALYPCTTFTGSDLTGQPVAIWAQWASRFRRGSLVVDLAGGLIDMFKDRK